MISLHVCRGYRLGPGQGSGPTDRRRTAPLFPTLHNIIGFLDAFQKLRKSHYFLRHTCPSVPLSAWNNSAPTGRIFMKFGIWVFFEHLSRKFQLHYNLTTITCTLHADRYTFLIIVRSVLLTMRNLSGKSCTENQNTHFVLSDIFSKIVPFMR